MNAGYGHLEMIGPTWYLRIRLPHVNPETGEVTRRQKRVVMGSKDKLRSEKAARAAADRWLAAQSPESLEPGLQVTVGEYLAHFMAIHVALMRPSSQRRYRSVVQFHLGTEFAADLLDAVDVRRIQAYTIRLAAKLSRETVRSVIGILMQVLTQARRDGFSVHRIDRQAIKMPKASAVSREQRNIDDGELQLLIAQSEWPWRALWAVTGYAGLRCGEALGLTWGHVDLENRVIRVRQSAVLGRLQLPKTATSRADVPILPELDAVLRQYRAVWVDNAQDLLFVARNGSPLRADNVRTRYLQPTLQRLGLRHSGLHAFRHGLPGRLNALGVSPGVVQKCMRHASLAQTEAYLHVGNADMHAALDAARARSTGSAGANRA